MNRWLETGIRGALGLGLAAAVLYYVLLGLGAVGGVNLLMPGALGALLKIHDILTLLLMGYWFHLAVNFRRLDRPLVPFAIFFMHIVVEPYLLLGARGAGFFHTGRFMMYYISYPLALAALGAWLLHWMARGLTARAPGQETPPPN